GGENLEAVPQFCHGFVQQLDVAAAGPVAGQTANRQQHILIQVLIFAGQVLRGELPDGGVAVVTGFGGLGSCFRLVQTSLSTWGRIVYSTGGMARTERTGKV